MTDPQPITITTHGWVELLYGQAGSPPGLMEFRLLDPQAGPDENALVERRWLEWPGDEPTIPLLPRKKWLKGSVYMGVAVRLLEARERKSGKAGDTHPTHLLFIDIDLKYTRYLDGEAEPEKLPPEVLRTAAQGCIADVLAQCEDLGLPPRAIVYSGHGLQVYWARSRRTTVEDTEAFNRGLAKIFEGDPVVTDQARILRVPGWIHHKNPDRPLSVELWHQDVGALVDDALLEPLALRRETVQVAGERLVNQGQVGAEDLSLLGETWASLKAAPVNGLGRHYLALYTSAWLKSNGYAEADASAVVHQLAAGAGDEELGDRLRAVRESYRADNPLGWQGLTDPERGFGLPLVGVALAPTARPKFSAPAQTPPRAARKAKDYSLLELAERFRERQAEVHSACYAHHERWQRWFEYQNGVYVEVLDGVMRKRVDQTLQDEGFTDLKKNDLSEILLKLAHMPGVGKLGVDQGAWELNCRNGVLDLRTLDLYEHDPEYFSIVQTAADWKPEATSADWEAFLVQAVPDPTDRATLQRYCGYCLTGDTSAQKALLLIGEGGTGKSTFMRVVTAALGGMGGHSLATSSALENIRDGSFLVGTLVGKRLCLVSELQRTVDWLPFKRITGEDPISIDVKNKDPFVAKLDAKLVILSNVIPLLKEDTSNGSLIRRFLTVGFNVRPASPDPTLEARLTTPENLSGVLTWMVRGLSELREAGMRFPRVGLNGLDREILEESNQCIEFLRDRCHRDGEVQSSDLFKAYESWCRDTGRAPVGSNRFARDLVAAGDFFGAQFDKDRRMTGRYWVGLHLSNLPGGWE